MDSDPGPHGEGEASTELEMARKDVQGPIRDELLCCAVPV
jgi:hypothetical protein